MNQQNPYSLTFGKEPRQLISRFAQVDEVVNTFSDTTPTNQVYMITGVRGSGKTVFMTSVVKTLQKNEEWIVVELNSSGELLKELAAKLYQVKGFSHIFRADGINLSLWGIGLNIKKAEPLTDLQTAVERMLQKLAKSGKRLLITIDEVSNSKEMRYFAGAFQMMIRHDLPVFLLMTGLYENINRLQNEENLTFLYRAPKIYLTALNTYRMSDSYKKTLKLPEDKALALARFTQGYPFAYQVFGYFAYQNNGDYESVIPDIRQYLDEYVYDKIWSELSAKETLILSAMATQGLTKVSDLKEALELKPNEFSVYRDRLIKKGILNGETRGSLRFALPFFDDYTREHRA